MSKIYSRSQFFIGLSCSDFDGVQMKASNPNYADLLNPKICCPKSCSNCNECYMSVLQPTTCSIMNDNMCYQENDGKQKCCANNVNKICVGKIGTPCRLRELDLNIISCLLRSYEQVNIV